MRLVLDTNVVIAAVVGSGAPTRLIELATEGNIELFASEALLAELAAVLDRGHIAERLRHKNRSAAETLALYEALVEVIVPALIMPTVEDPGDDAVLACALAARADMIVSGDTRVRNVKYYHRIPILSPAQALVRLPAQSDN